MKKSVTHNTNSKIVSVGLDLAKNSFSLHAFDEAGNTVLAENLKRDQVTDANLALRPNYC